MPCIPVKQTRTPYVNIPGALLLALSAAFGSLPGLLHADEPAAPTKSDLLGVYQEAVINNADIAASRADYQAVKEVVPQARAGLLPQINVGGSYTDNRYDVKQFGNTLNRSGLLFQASLNQAIIRADRWFQLRAAKAVNKQAALQLAALEQNLIMQSAESYFAVLRAQDALAANRAEEAAFKRQYEQAKERFDVGMSDRTDLLEALAGYDTARANRIVAERQVLDAFQALTTLTNRDYRFVQGIRHSLPVAPPIPNDAQSWVNTAVKSNLNLQASQYAVTGAEETLRQRQSGHAPTVDLVARYQRGDNDSLGYINNRFTSQFINYSGTVSQSSINLELNIPLYTGGLTSSQVRESYQRLSQSEQQREGLRRLVVQDTRNFHRAVNTDVEQVQARKQAIISNQSSLEATEIGYQVGSRNIVDVLQAQRSLYSAVRSYNNARYDYILDQLRLKQAAGVLSPDDLQSMSRYLKPDYDPDRDFLPPGIQLSAARPEL